MPKTTNKQAHQHLRSGRWITERKRFAIYIRDSMRCVYCGKDISSEVGKSGVVLDHIVSGRGNAPTNLVTSCKRCNDSKSGKSITAWADKTVIHRVESQRKKEIDEIAGQALYEQRKGLVRPTGLPKFKRLTIDQAAALVQMAPAEVEARIERKEFEANNKGVEVVSLVQRSLTLARRVAELVGEKSDAAHRRAIAEAETAERRNLREAGELIPTVVAVGLVEPIMVVIRQKICASSLTDAEKDDMLADMERAKDLDWGRAAREAAK